MRSTADSRRHPLLSSPPSYPRSSLPTVDYAKQVQPIFNTCAACHIGDGGFGGPAAGYRRGRAGGQQLGQGHYSGQLQGQLAGAAHLRHYRQSDAAQRHAHQGADQDHRGLDRSGRERRMRPRAPVSVAPRKFPPSVATVSSPQMEHGYFEAYCFTCHSGPNAKAGLELDKLDTAHIEKDAEKWERVVRMLRSGMMPKAGMPRPGSEDLRSRDGVDGE